MKRGLPNPHPGEILMEEFLKPMALSQTALASATRCVVPPTRGRSAAESETEIVA
jgi:plasmid maintenance system antidote protein VapI